MKHLFTLLLLVLITSTKAQVGINTTTPTKTFDVNGETRLRVRPQGTISDSLLVTDTSGNVRRLAINQLQLSNNSGTCPNFLKSQSSGYHIKFSSPSSVPNPQDNLTIQGKNFNQAGQSIVNNTYYFSWSNTTGQPININNMTVIFGGVLTCIYN